MNATQQKFKPILFSTEMVKAILAGRKTQTRRIIKVIPRISHTVDGMVGLIKQGYLKFDEGIFPINSGDVLWVRETFGTTTIGTMYKANVCSPDCDKPLSGWKPSLLMPKEAARIFLKVTNVRVERLQDISENDAIAEGVASAFPASDMKFAKDLDWVIPRPFLHHQFSFLILWQKINGKKYPWDSNPGVWVYDFERIEKPENFI